MTPAQGYRTEIDGLRAIAVISVILFHLGFPHITGGFVGVDVFFVISGFLITSIIQREIGAGKFSIAEFYEKRANRILPVLFAVIAVVLLCGTAFLAPHNLMDLGGSSTAATLFVSNIFFWRTVGYFEVAAEVRPLLHTWSLAVEEQFYLFFPLLLVAIEKTGRLKLAITSLIILSSLALAIILGTSPASFYLLPCRVFELGAGSILAMKSYPQADNQRASEIFGIAGLICILVSLFALDPSFAFPGPWALAPAIGTAFALHGGANSKTMTHRLLSLPVLRIVGQISFSAYMWHWPAIVAARIYFAAPPPLPIRALLFAAIMVMAAVSWKYIEQPFRKQTILGRAKTFARYSFIGSILIAAGSSIVMFHGLPGRFPYGPTPIGAESVRAHECFLDFTDSVAIWSTEKCSAGSQSEDAPTAFVWGDSFAAHYVAGLNQLNGKQLEFRTIQASFAACPPFLDSRAHLDQRCSEFNKQVATSLAKIKPRLLIVAASWSHQESVFYSDPDKLRDLLQDMIDKVRDAGVQKIIVIGDSPRYYIDVEQINLTEASDFAKPRNDNSLDATLSKLASPDVQFLSPMRTLCRDEKCRFRDAQKKILQWDDGHFTLTGSEFMAKKMLQTPMLDALAGSTKGP